MSEYANQSFLNKARVDKWFVVIPIPSVLSTINSTEITNMPNFAGKIHGNNFIFSLEKVNTPSISVPTKNAPYGGQTAKLSSHTRKEYEDVEFDFSIDNRFGNYYFIYAWLNILASDFDTTYDKDNVTPKNYQITKDGHILQMLKHYCTTMSVVAVDEFNVPIIQFNFEGAFPNKLSPVKFNYQDKSLLNASASFSFTFYSISFPSSIEGIARFIPSTTATTTTSTTTTITTETTTSTTIFANGVC